MKVEKPIHSFQDLKKEEKHHILSIYDFLTHSLRIELKKRPWEFVIIFFVVLILTSILSGILISIITGGVNIRFSTPRLAFSNLSLPNLAGAEISTGGRSIRTIDPIILLEKIKKDEDDYLLIDIRSNKDYEIGHIKTAVNMPVYGTSLIKKDGSLDKGVIRRNISDNFPNKKMVIVYGDSSYSVLSQEVADAIGGNGYALGIGWNEWRHFKALWVPESMWDEMDINNYIQIRE